MIDIRRRHVLIGACVLLGASLAQAQPTVAQQPASKIVRLGYLTNDSISIDLPRRTAFRQGLRDLGYLEGQNTIIEYRVAGGDSEKLPEMMAELLRLKVDVVFAFNTSSILVAKSATKETPIVFVALNPVEIGVVASLARPGGNMTGLSLTAGPAIYRKMVELLKEIVPATRRIAALWNPRNPGNALQLKEMQSAVAVLGMTVHAFDAKDPDHLEPAFAAMRNERAEALLVLLDPMLLAQRQRIADLAVKGGLPSIYGVPEHAEAGGLMVYAADRLDIFRRAAAYVDKILKGAKPADLPVEQPTKFDLVINLRTAKALGLTIPPSLLFRAARVIE